MTTAKKKNVLKTKPRKTSPATYIASIKDGQKRNDAAELVKLFKSATGLQPKMWGTSIVGFGSYHYKSERSRQEGDWPLTGFSARVQNLTVYIMPGFKTYGALLKKLGKHTTSGGSCIYIKRLDDINKTVLKRIIRDSVAVMRKRHPSSA